MKKLTLFIVVLFTTMMAFAQVNPNAPLERDSQTRYGKLDNGLTYFIRHNDKPAQRAEYYLFTNVGAIQETPAQAGLAHFLEHMALNGTKNLPGKMMLDYFQSIGASFGGNINASTGVEQTMYMLNNIPTTRQGIIDTALLIMHDYSGYVTNDPVEIDKERGVIVEEWRTRRTADWRMMEKQWEYLYTGSKYATCNIIGTKENLETFPASELQDFYKTWYRPDLQAIAIVGDIDVDAVEAQLKDLFKDIPARENPKPKDVHKLPSNAEPIVGIITDPEARMTSVSLYVKTDPLPKEYKAIGAGFMIDMIQDVIAAMFSERFEDLTNKADAPFLAAGASFNTLVVTSDAFVVNAIAKDGDGLSAFKAALTEVEKAKRFGFTEGEYERAKANIIKYAERDASNAGSRKNSDFIGDFYMDFFMGVPAMSPEYKEAQYKGYLSMIPLAQINQIVAALPLDKDLVILYTAPEKEGLTHPTKDQLINTVKEVKTAQLQSNAVEEVMEPLVNADLLKGSPVKKEEKGMYGSTVWTLKNGIKVIVRPSDYNKEEVRLSLKVDGGKSLIAIEDLPSMDDNVLSLYGSMAGVSKFPQSKLSKMLAGKVAGVYPSIGEIGHGVSGNCSPKDFETMMQLVYLQICDPRFNADEFAPVMAQLNAIVPNIEKQPNFIMSTAYINTAYNNNPRKEIISSEMLSKISLASLEKSYKALFSNMAGAQVFITGNVDLATIKPIVEKYIGSLPVARKESKYIDHNLEVVPGKVEKIFTTAMETPKTTSLMVFSGKTDYTLENTTLMRAFKYILNLVYTETIREEAGGTYGVSTQSGISQLPKQQGQMIFQFDADPDKAEMLLNLAISGIENIAKNGPTDAQMTMTKENFLKNIPENRINNGYWSNCLSTYYKLGVDLDTKSEEIVNSLTAAKIQKFAADLLNQGNVVKVVMSPAK
ncbi:MAG: insulinase family protein [Bacteroidales bacterium]|nr:insulinase family protein [Bacteroidales bacterium]MDD4669733.1 insulinase family protein [Bacteroidales bacterium]